MNEKISKKEINKKVIDVENARDHLNNAPEEYFTAINECIREEYESTIKKLRPIKANLANPRLVASIGVGGGLEVRVLSELFNDKETMILGVDLSDKALRIARNYLNKNNIEAHLIQSSAVHLPFEKNKIDGIVFSAILHEIYSYVEDGKFAWKKAIQEATTSLSPNGVLLLRDFASPFEKGDIRLSFLTDESKRFYSYFINNFRNFTSWTQTELISFIDKRVGNKDYPKINSGNDSIKIPFDKAAEMILHFKTHQSDIENNCVKPFSDGWKEIDERYLPFNPNQESDKTMDINEYVNEVIICSGNKLACINSELSPRPEVAKYFMKHFGITKEGMGNPRKLYEQIPAKMELVFKKIN